MEEEGRLLGRDVGMKIRQNRRNKHWVLNLLSLKFHNIVCIDHDDFSLFFTLDLWFNVIGTVDSTDRWCGLGDAKEGEHGQVDWFFFHFVCIYSFSLKYSCINEFGLI